MIATRKYAFTGVKPLTHPALIENARRACEIQWRNIKRRLKCGLKKKKFRDISIRSKSSARPETLPHVCLPTQTSAPRAFLSALLFASTPRLAASFLRSPQYSLPLLFHLSTASFFLSIREGGATSVGDLVVPSSPLRRHTFLLSLELCHSRQPYYCIFFSRSVTATRLWLVTLFLCNQRDLHIDLEPVETERPGELIAYYKIMTWKLHQTSLNTLRPLLLYLILTRQSWLFLHGMIMGNSGSYITLRFYIGQTSFPGWILTKSTWEELSPKWPKAYWDDWMRLKDVHKDRQFIHPEVCRIYNFGEHQEYPFVVQSFVNKGSSMGQFFQQYLQPIRLNDVQVN